MRRCIDLDYFLNMSEQVKKKARIDVDIKSIKDASDIIQIENVEM